MAGLFGLFGGKSKDGKSEAFYLDSDQAQTMGDVEFMRKKQRIKKTFPKMMGGQPSNMPETYVEATSMERTQSFSNSSSASSPTPSTTPSFSNSSTSSFSKPSFPTQSTERRRPDSNLDEFRKMAKDMRK
ncbi:MAG: hypothetical protein SWJ54_03680 [Cyanobacteriota bacterium]|nr:hypothetical protein [Cyanobacteriota bacterium]